MAAAVHEACGFDSLQFGRIELYLIKACLLSYSDVMSRATRASA